MSLPCFCICAPDTSRTRTDSTVAQPFLVQLGTSRPTTQRHSDTTAAATASGLGTGGGLGIACVGKSALACRSLAEPGGRRKANRPPRTLRHPENRPRPPRRLGQVSSLGHQLLLPRRQVKPPRCHGDRHRPSHGLVSSVRTAAPLPLPDAKGELRSLNRTLNTPHLVHPALFRNLWVADPEVRPRRLSTRV